LSVFDSKTGTSASRQAEPATPDQESASHSSAEAARREVRRLVAGLIAADVNRVVNSQDKAVRQVVAGELLAAMARANPEEHQRAQQLFLTHGYFDETINALRAAESSEERAGAARTLGTVGSRLGTLHLIAASFDTDASVREAAAEAISKIDDPSLAGVSLSDLLNDEMFEQGPQESPAETLTQDIESPESLADPAIGSAPAIEWSTTAHAADADSLDLEEETVRNSSADLRRRLAEAAITQKAAQEQVHLIAEDEAAIRAEAAARRREEENLRQRAAEETARLTTAQAARVQAEEELDRLAEEEIDLRLHAETLKQAARELSAKRAEIETARKEASLTAQRAEVKRQLEEAADRQRVELEHLRIEEESLRQTLQERQSVLTAFTQDVQTRVREFEAEHARLTEEQAALSAEGLRVRQEVEEQNRVAQEQLASELAGLHRTSNEVAAQRAEVEAARQRAEEESGRLLEAQARIQIAEDERRALEAERLRLESEIRLQIETEHRLLEESHRRLEDEERRLEQAARSRLEEEEHRLAELEALRQRTERDLEHQNERERQLKELIQTLEGAEAEALKRIEEAEARRRTAEETHRLAEEKAQRFEAEAHISTLEEEQVIAKLEGIRRNIALEVQGRSEQERRIKEEIEQLRRVGDEQQRRIESETRRRAEEEILLQRERERYRVEEEARAKAELQLEQVAARGAMQRGEATEWSDDPEENLKRVTPPRTLPFPAETFEPVAQTLASHGVAELSTSVQDQVAAPAPSGILEDLAASDPDRRVNALSSIASTKPENAFDLIAGCFDDAFPQVRKAAARALRAIEPHRTVELFNRALDEGTDQRRRNIGAAIADSGLATESIDDLNSESREETYNALCLLFVMAKTGEVQPLVTAIETHPNYEIRRAVIKLLTLSGQSDIADEAVKRRLDGTP